MAGKPQVLDEAIAFYYPAALQMQLDIQRDTAMVANLAAGRVDAKQIASWMQSYGLFQGVSSEDRRVAVQAFKQFCARRRPRSRFLSEADRRNLFLALSTQLNIAVSRSWMSATSKLLWCLYPYDVVIYDRFVYHSMLALQKIDPMLRQLPAIGSPPRPKEKNDLEAAADFYMRFDTCVRRLYKQSDVALKLARRMTKLPVYSYDIRIFDKILWIFGSANFQSASDSAD